MFKTQPFQHQASEYESSKDLPVRALFWEMGTGKSWLVLNTAAHLYREGKVDAAIVIAPNGVTTNWVTDELPAHLPMDIPILSHIYESRRAGTKWHQQRCSALLGFHGLSFLTLSYEAFMTLEGRRLTEKLLSQRKVLYVLDESHKCKSPGAKRTISIVASGRRATYKRILTGTPITNRPFDCYSQIKFLDEDFWKKRDFGSYEAFKTFFGIWEQRVNGATGSRFMHVVAFKNLDRLAAMVAEIAGRVTKDEVLDLPPKMYKKVYFDLSDEQRAAYDQLKQEFLLLLDSGETVSAPLIITRLLRLQQISCGYLPIDDTDGQVVRFVPNPRITALVDLLDDIEGKAIIFARFRDDVSQIMAVLGREAVRYDGAVDDDGRLEARKRFQEDPAIRYFVGNPAAAGLGLTLHAASTCIYYSNSFDAGQRWQSEDRCYRIGQTKNVTIVDLVAKNTVDVKIVQSLRDKQDLASQVTGDAVREWLNE